MDILRFVQRLFVDDVKDLGLMLTGACLLMIAVTTIWQCMWRWRIPRERQCCSSESSFCSYRIWTCSQATSTSPWISTTMTTVSTCPRSSLLVLRVAFEVSSRFCQPLQLTTNRQASKRANVIVSGLKASWQTSRWVRFRRASTPSECACQQIKEGWRSSRKGTNSSRICRFLAHYTCRQRASRCVDKVLLFKHIFVRTLCSCIIFLITQPYRPHVRGSRKTISPPKMVSACDGAVRKLKNAARD